MKISRILVVVITLLTTFTIAFSQSKRKANRYYNQLTYKKAVKAYKKIYNKGDDSYNVISRLADSYYFNSNTVDAEKWYAILFEKYPNKITDKHLFRYAHSLKGNQNYDDANSIIRKLAAVDNDDQMAKEFLENPNYYSEFKSNEYNLAEFKNLSVNTKYSDFGGFIFQDQLYFASAKPTKEHTALYNWNEQPFLNLYKSKIRNTAIGNQKEDIKLDSSSLVRKPIRTKYHESNAIFTKDGKTMYFTRDNFFQGKKRISIDHRIKLKIYKATFLDSVWGNIVELPFNNDQYSAGHPALSPDERTLYFVSDKPGGFGSTDIYKVAINDDGTYGNPINLGENINTQSREMFPFVSSDNTFYFSSDGHLGLGGLDIFESLITNTNGIENYGAIKNLQVPFNSSLDDFAFYIDSKNYKGFVSSNRKGGKGDDDIYSYILKDIKRRTDYDCKKVINGLVTNLKTGAILPNAKVAIYDKKGRLLNQATSDAKGKFKFPVNCLSDFYKITGTKPNFRDASLQVDTKKLVSTAIFKLALDPIIVKQVTVIETRPKFKPKIFKPQDIIKTIYFNYNKSNIRKGDSEFELDHIVDVMNSRPNMIIKIESHTDSRGARWYNQRLSQKRADRTKKYLISKGIAPYRIESAIGYGESRLLNDCDDAHQKQCTEEQHQRNRRSYFIVVSGGEDVIIDRNTSPLIIDRKSKG